MSERSRGEKWGRFFIRLMIGMVVSYVGLAISVGSLSDAIGFMALSIICTAGISLALWIPGWWIVGWLVLLVIETINGKRSVDSSGSTVPEDLSEGLNPIVRFMVQARAGEMDDSEIRRRLIRAGWPKKAIDQAAKRVDETNGG